MNYATFKISVNESIAFLKKQELLKGKGVKDIGDHSEEFKKISRKNKHTTIFDTAVMNNDYEALLFDDSIFQFSFNDGALRYAFIQNPDIYISKSDYLSTIYTPDELLTLSNIEYSALINSIKEEEYEQFLNEQELNIEAHIIRYDLDVTGYAPLLHPYSHIHIGLNENLRIPCSKVLTPLKFVMFCIKHTYNDKWKNAFKTDSNFENIINDNKKKCVSVPNGFWITKEKYDLFLD